MLEILLIFVVSLIPGLLSVWHVRRIEARNMAGLQAAMRRIEARQMQRMQMPSDQHYIEGVGYLIGDITCQFNAHSAYIRCAVNPFGPCHECSSYKSREYN
ncbi:hypothetical protein H6F78_04250 [Coleofasciculus sp. FACHB-64]|uniref:DUF6464 family protein n=1 Tax=Cyanophyceae TaxID=3028117 RepID=UPI0016870AE4|nr:hypothetical protein [Coleofasciculus sp. FACHB-501]MBD1882371.1 hypothetical protein [Coleofasciculus sp. FACHB-T130]MBD1899119.1 hypothetical protein [Coleofasciculus sp. FACHB-125]MBD2044850.1 hypothetical protein [Coleofasciculus sp. FACHB-64]MBD2086029.1 hypothetical protein [Coleofasciculus sp. FACHB-542]